MMVCNNDNIIVLFIEGYKIDHDMWRWIYVFWREIGTNMWGGFGVKLSCIILVLQKKVNDLAHQLNIRKYTPPSVHLMRKHRSTEPNSNCQYHLSSSVYFK
jgi:hypothetical protein